MMVSEEVGSKSDISGGSDLLELESGVGLHRGSRAMVWVELDAIFLL